MSLSAPGPAAASLARVENSCHSSPRFSPPGGAAGMAWRDSFLRWFGPGMLGGITFGSWVRLLCDNCFDVSPSRLVRATAITAQSAQNSVLRRIEDLRWGASVRDAEVLPPLFVLGHWRSGTTH